ncbi:hypothetical protein CIP107554_01898 [Corynebacterium diphtheriae]|nr:hypothetical protein CIP107554_01898 [Corynebacterium diphtheriae]
MASQEVGHSTWFRSCIPIISVKKCESGKGAGDEFAVDGRHGAPSGEVV